MRLASMEGNTIGFHKSDVRFAALSLAIEGVLSKVAPASSKVESPLITLAVNG